ncbi:MAG TPA: serine hydrolase [Pyrinomonadaceae bacterium]|nr:serine hydrolase [Pyrinomonadaceae bacterium]
MKIVVTQFAHRRAVGLFVVLVALALQTTALAQDKAARIDEYMKRSAQIRQFNGAVLVAENGKVIYKKGLGMANMEWNVANDVDTKFRLGSITKQFTAMLVLQLVEQGKLKLDGKLSEYLPDYRKDIGDKVTIHHLLTHTSGIPSYTGLPKFFEDASRNPYTVVDFVKKYASNDLEFEPGAKFKYNNSGYFLLGAIIEKVTGKPYEQVLKENILDPLGMKNTGYDHYDAILPKRASGYQKTPAGYTNAPYLDMSIPYAAGSLYSTVEDLYLWDQALYTDKLIPAKSKELMFKPFLDNYAYGWTITKAALGKETVNAVAHGGGINGFNTYLVRYPDQKNLIVLLDNTSQGASLNRITRDLTSILYNQPVEMPKQSIAEVLMKTITERDVASAIKQYRDLKAAKGADYNFGENELNMLGYQLLGAKRMKEAIEIFKLNVEAYPQAANPYDSLGEAYLAAGERALALQNYKKSVELNPDNANAVAIIKRLETPASETTASATPVSLDAYAGQYDVPGLGTLDISKEGDKLFGAPTGQTKAELIPQGNESFLAAGPNVHLTFIKDDKGQVTHVNVRLRDGREMQAKKVK